VEPANKPNPTSLVIFGGGGDLAWRKLVPALYDLCLDDSLPDKFTVLGLDLKKFSGQKFRDHLREGVDKFSRHGKTKASEWKKFASKIS
jgi:glucose-6-phosphate 1-dehydrogenase